jgi:hypothetical protein
MVAPATSPATKEKKVTAKWDAEFDCGPCDRYNNAELTLTLRLHIEKVDPSGFTGTYPDHNGTPRRIARWGALWTSWTQTFKRDCETFWGGRLWLKSPLLCHKYDFSDKGVIYQPNVWCRFKVALVSTAAAAHKSIKAVRLAPTESFFRSNDSLYDHRDIQPVAKAHGGKKITHVHEVGHAIGLPHVGQGDRLTLGGLVCAIHQLTGGSTNDKQCYGITTDEQRDAMGSGDELREWHAKPWQEAMSQFSGFVPGAWVATKQRHYPRTLVEVLTGRWHTAKPPRG